MVSESLISSFSSMKQLGVQPTPNNNVYPWPISFPEPAIALVSRDHASWLDPWRRPKGSQALGTRLVHGCHSTGNLAVRMRKILRCVAHVTHCSFNKGYYMLARGYEFYLRVCNSKINIVVYYINNNIQEISRRFPNIFRRLPKIAVKISCFHSKGNPCNSLKII